MFMQTQANEGFLMRLIRVLALAAADLAVLLGARPNFTAVGRGLAHLPQWLKTDPDGAALGFGAAVLWVLALWVAIALLVALGTACDGVIGRVARWTRRRFVPAALYRIAAGAAGVGVALSPAVATAAPTPATTPPPATALPAVTAPAWPTDAPTLGPAKSRGDAVTRAGGDRDTARTPAWPTRPRTAPASSPTPATPGWPTPGQGGPPPATTATTPNPAAVAVPAPGPPSASVATSPPPSPSHRRPVDAGTAGDEVDRGTAIVRPGDSLWLIAQRRLGPSASPAQVSAEWRRWYAANRERIGADPALIRPGQVLHAPAEASPPGPER